MLSDGTLEATLLTLKLATFVTLILLILGTPLAWWLAHTRSWFRIPLSAIILLPFVLPPSVLGFYLLLAMGPQGLIGRLCAFLNLESLAFSFNGLVVASLVHSLPFMLQPLHNSFLSLGQRPLEVAATLGSSPRDSFCSVVVPLCSRGFFSGIIMTFAHTIGEFGVVLMIGGNIANKTRVLSTQVYDLVESMAYEEAHVLSSMLLLFSFVVMAIMQFLQIKDREINSPRR